jgi:transposase
MHRLLLTHSMTPKHLLIRAPVTITGCMNLCVVNAVVQEGNSITQAAHVFRLPRATVYNIIQRYMNYGSIDDRPRRMTTLRIITPEMDEAIMEELAQNPTSNARDVIQFLQNRFHVTVCANYIHAHSFVRLHSTTRVQDECPGRHRGKLGTTTGIR